MSKLIEKAVASQSSCDDHILGYYLDETFPFSYKTFHSSETVLVRVHKIFLLLSSTITPLFYFYLTYLPPLTLWITDSILLSSLSFCFGIKGTALAERFGQLMDWRYRNVIIIKILLTQNYYLFA